MTLWKPGSTMCDGCGAADCVPLAQYTSQGQDPAKGKGRITWTMLGAVQHEPSEPGDIGARACTNNTGELSAMYYAIERARGRARGRGKEIIWTDSLYTMHMTTGRWMTRSKRNAVLVRALRAKWRRLQRTRPGEVELRHVRSHTECPGNELADALADRGKDASPKNAVGWQHEETTTYTVCEGMDATMEKGTLPRRWRGERRAKRRPSKRGGRGPMRGGVA